MELQFVKQGGEWVAEFEATSDFNINLDRTNKGYLLIYQKGAADGTWATYPSYKNYKEAANIDVDVTALIYPKYIKVVSQSEVEKAIVTMEGESGGNTQQYPIFAKITLSNSIDENTFTSDSDNYNEVLGMDSLNITYDTYAYVTAEIFYKKGEDLIPCDNLLNYEITQSSIFDTLENGIISVAKEGNRIITTYAAYGINGGSHQYVLKINGELIAQHYILKV